MCRTSGDRRSQHADSEPDAKLCVVVSSSKPVSRNVAVLENAKALQPIRRGFSHDYKNISIAWFVCQVFCYASGFLTMVAVFLTMTAVKYTLTGAICAKSMCKLYVRT